MSICSAEAPMDMKRLQKASVSADVVALDGRWIVTGPNNPDGSGWTLCETDETGACTQCWADVRTRAMAMRVAEVLGIEPDTDPIPIKPE